MLTVLIAAATLSVVCADLQRGFAFDVRPGLRASVRQTSDDRFDLSVNGHQVRAAGECLNDTEQALVADFNFDGLRDVAIPTGSGYGGVNTFYDLYLYQPSGKTFRRARASDVGNPEPDPRTRTVTAPYKSGPAYALATLCLAPGGDLYQCRLGEINLDAGVAQNADDYDWQWFDPAGKVVLRLPLRRSGEDRSVWTVTAVRASLRPAPDAVAIRPYLVRGDRVEVLELRGAWAYVSYSAAGGRVFAGWLRRSELRQP